MVDPDIDPAVKTSADRAAKLWRMSTSLGAGVANKLIVAAITGFLSSLGVIHVLSNWMDSQSAIVRTRDWLSERLMSPMPHGTFNIVVTDIAGDRNGTSVKHVIRAFETQLDVANPNVAVRVQQAALRMEMGQGRDHATLLTEAEGRARTLLTRLNGDILVWGDAIDEGSLGRVLHLRITRREARGEGRANGYLLSPEFRLPDKFGNDLANVLAAAAVAQGEQAREQGRFVAGVLEPMLPKLDVLVQNPPRGLGPEQLVALRQSLAMVLGRIGDQRRDYRILTRAVAEWRQIADQLKGTAPRKRADALANLALALTTLGESINGKERLVESIAVYAEALAETSADDDPLLTAVIRSGRAEALRWIGETGNDRLQLVAAEADLIAALDLLQRLDNPLRRAMTLNQLGDTHRAFADVDADKQRLRPAEAAFRSALAFLSREAHPLLWAETMANLADVLRRYGDEPNGTTHLETSIKHYADAEAVWNSYGMKIDGATALLKRCIAEGLLGEKTKSVKILNASAATCASAVKLFDPELNALYWAEAQMALAEAERALGALRRDAKLLDSAKVHIDLATTAFKKSGATGYVAKAETVIMRIAVARQSIR